MAKKIAKKITDVEAGTVTFQFTDESELVVSLADYSEDTVARAALHGLSQKVGDSYSGAESVKAARESAEATIENLKEGNWNTVREGSSTPRVGALAAALARATGKTVEEATEVINMMDDDQKKALRVHPQVKAASAAIRSEKAAADAAEAEPLKL